MTRTRRRKIENGWRRRSLLCPIVERRRRREALRTKAWEESTENSPQVRHAKPKTQHSSQSLSFFLSACLPQRRLSSAASSFFLSLSSCPPFLLRFLPFFWFSFQAKKDLGVSRVLVSCSSLSVFHFSFSVLSSGEYCPPPLLVTDTPVGQRRRRRTGKGGKKSGGVAFSSVSAWVEEFRFLLEKEGKLRWKKGRQREAKGQRKSCHPSRKHKLAE